MKARQFRILALTAALALFAAPVAAQSVQDGIIDQLRAQGYEAFTVERTLLGRIRIVAQSDEFYREIVLNPASGEILRDYWRERDDDGGAASVPIIRSADRRDDQDGGNDDDGGDNDEDGGDNDDGGGQPDGADDEDGPDQGDAGGDAGGGDDRGDDGDAEDDSADDDQDG